MMWSISGCGIEGYKLCTSMVTKMASSGDLAKCDKVQWNSVRSRGKTVLEVVGRGR